MERSCTWLNKFKIYLKIKKKIQIEMILQYIQHEFLKVKFNDDKDNNNIDAKN